MAPELLDIPHRELIFTFELKKQCSCSVQLVNKSNEHVAFKVKTTSPKRYCVRPNTGVIPPRSTCDFTVTMQAQRTAPPDMQLKDKFLVQSTIVPFGTTDEDLDSSIFAKQSGRYIEEHKLRVVLVSPPHSPVLQPINGALKQETVYDASVLKEAPILKETPSLKEAASLKETPILKESRMIPKDEAVAGVESLHPSHVAKDVEDLESKLNDLEMKLNEADKTIRMLREEKVMVTQERDKLQQEIVSLRRKSVAKVQVGFPLFFVIFIALVGVALGYLLHP